MKQPTADQFERINALLDEADKHTRAATIAAAKASTALWSLRSLLVDELEMHSGDAWDGLSGHDLIGAITPFIRTADDIRTLGQAVDARDEEALRNLARKTGICVHLKR